MSKEINKRVGPNGKFKKNVKFIQNPDARKMKETAKLKSLTSIIQETAVLTNMPVAVLAMKSDGQIYIAGSTKGLGEFILDKTIQTKFLDEAKKDLTPELKVIGCSENLDIGKRKRSSFIDENGDFAVPGDWEKFDAHDKRDLVRDLVAWDCGRPEAQRISWKKESRPDWWPSDIPFKQPKNMCVEPLDKIIKTSIKSNITHFMDCLAEYDLPDTRSFDKLLAWSASFLLEAKLVKSWLKKWTEPSSLVDKALVTLKYREVLNVENVESHPVCFERITQCLSFSVLQSKKYDDFFERFGLASCVKNYHQLLTMNHRGDDMIPPIEEEPDKFAAAVLADPSLMTEISKLIGIAIECDLVIEWHRENDWIKLGPYLADRTPLRVGVINKEFCSLVKTEDFSIDVCGENPFCISSPSSNQMTCGQCGLRYHITCVGDEDECGCRKIGWLKERIKNDILDVKRFERNTEKSAHIARSFIEDICQGNMKTRRSVSIGSLPLDVNKFFTCMMLKESRQHAVTFVTQLILNDGNLQRVVKEFFPESELANVIADCLVPDVIIKMIEVTNRVPRVTVERSLLQLTFDV